MPIDSARGYRLGSIALIVAAAAWHAWVASTMMWRLDDWVYLIRTDTMNFTDYVLQDYNGHAMPLQFAFVWLVTKVLPMSFTAQTVIIALMTAAGVAAWSLAFEEIFGPRRRLLVPLSIIALTPISLFSSSFWASAVQLFPLQAFMGVAVFYAARTGRRVPGATWRLVFTYVLALLWWEKSLLMLMPIAAVVILCSQGTVRSRVRALIPVAIATVLYLPGYLWLRGRVAETMPTWFEYPDSTSERAAQYFQHSWTVVPDLVVPALLGGPWGTVPILGDFYDRPNRILAYALTSIVVVVLAMVAQRRGRQSLIPLLLASSYLFTASTLIMFSTKYQLLGPDALYEDRYFPDVMAVLMLCVAMLSCSVRDHTVSPPTTERSRSVRGGALLFGVGIGVLVSLAASNAMLWPQMPPEPGRPWVEGLSSELRDSGPVSVRDSVPPKEVLEAGLWPEGFKVSRMFASLDSEARFGAPGNPIMNISPEGMLEPMAIRSSIASDPGPQPACGYFLSDGLDVDIPISGNLFGYFWGIELAMFSGSGGELSVTVDGETQHITIPSGLSSPQFLHIGTIATMSVRLDGQDASACLAAAHAGEVVDDAR